MKKYEKKEGILLLSTLFFLLEIIFIMTLFTKKEYIYVTLTGVVSKDNNVLLIVSEKERKILMKSNYLFYEDKKTEYELLEDHGIVLKKNKVNYKEIILKMNTKNKKINESITLTIKNKKISILKILKSIWDGD